MRAPLTSVILLAALAAGCRPADEEPRSAGGNADLEAPVASTVTLAGLLRAATTGYDNAQQARYLQEESKRLGISRLEKPSGPTGESNGPPRDPIGYEEGIERTKTMTKDFAAQRRAIEKGQPKAIGLEGTTPGMLPGKPQGGPIEDAPEDGPKDPEKK
ncbi:MAG: hypothetical protein A2506_07795 [Elusimicrobia bacterium RIFOXYD12_FULL_66_9]|nr:MAG: hypothetical protein A2506_07795 [Elusimicrobia bacterium RIFOXYD12_FULL_66_9]